MSEIQVGDEVMYVPAHARGDMKHEDCEPGVVVSKGRYYLFVKYPQSETPMATRPEDLVKFQ